MKIIVVVARNLILWSMVSFSADQSSLENTGIFGMNLKSYLEEHVVSSPCT